MIGRRGVLLLGAAAGVTIGAAVWFQPKNEAEGQFQPGALAFPGLAPRLAQAAKIELVRHNQTTTLTRDGDDWRIAEQQGYRSRPERVRELLTGLTELRLVEERTSDPSRYASLGVDDPRQEGSTATLLRVLDAQGTAIAELILGRRRVRTQGNVPESVYVRRPAEARSWLAEGRVLTDADPGLWVNRDIVALVPDRLRRVEIARNGEPALVLARAGEVDAPLEVVTPPNTIADRGAVEEVARAFDMLSFVEVRRAADAPGEALGEAKFTYTDGLTITVRPQQDGQVLWVKLTAEGDSDEARQLQARWDGWAYQLGIWKEKALVPRLADLLPEAPATDATPTAPPAQ
ncbi:DUF4340 domain-containing protein [Roseococcus sp. YIM B11640]|uniref:DUF4340 domain-containing protein n=1 Tax=Roseococcus sp. YIM B11640 TaxID=3133973 RepID=UPI003C7C6682